MPSADRQTPDDASLARQARAGDLVAFGELVERHQRAVFQFLLYRCGNRQDAEDLVQASFVAAFRAIGRFDDRHRFYSWIFTIARRQCIDLLRRRRDQVPLDAAGEPPCPGGGADAAAARADDAEGLWARVRALLPPAQAEALWLVYKDGQPIAEAARALGWSQVRLKVTLHRARGRLRALLPAVPPALSLARPVSLLQSEKT